MRRESICEPTRSARVRLCATVFTLRLATSAWLCCSAVACSGSSRTAVRATGDAGRDAAPAPANDDAGQDAAPAQAEGDSGQDAAPPGTEDDAARLEREAEFWDEVAICGEPVEDYATVTAAAAVADAIVVGRIIGAKLGNVVQGDAAEDFYAEVNLIVEIEEVLGPTTGSPLAVSLILASVTPEWITRTIAGLAANLPEGRVVLLLRAREDFPDVYIPMGGDKGLWTQTARDALDNPIAGSFCPGHYGDEVRATFLEGVRSLEELVELLR